MRGEIRGVTSINLHDGASRPLLEATIYTFDAF
jgi:hypothetical protein